MVRQRETRSKDAGAHLLEEAGRVAADQRDAARVERGRRRHLAEQQRARVRGLARFGYPAKQRARRWRMTRPKCDGRMARNGDALDGL